MHYRARAGEHRFFANVFRSHLRHPRAVHVTPEAHRGTRITWSSDMRLPGIYQRANWAYALALLSLTSCIDNPTAPSRLRPLAPNASISVAGPLGTFTIPVVSSNAPPTNGALAEQGTGIFLPDNSTVEITVSGAVHVQRTPGYLGDPNMGEESPLAGRDISPAGVTGQLHVSLNVGSGTTGTDTTTEVWLVRVNTGFELRVSRTGAAGGMHCMDPPAGPPTCQCPSGPCSLVLGSVVCVYKRPGHHGQPPRRRCDALSGSVHRCSRAKRHVYADFRHTGQSHELDLDAGQWKRSDCCLLVWREPVHHPRVRIRMDGRRLLLSALQRNATADKACEGTCDSC